LVGEGPAVQRSIFRASDVFARLLAILAGLSKEHGQGVALHEVPLIGKCLRDELVDVRCGVRGIDAIEVRIGIVTFRLSVAAVSRKGW
jgi:hypothetical protein